MTAQPRELVLLSRTRRLLAEAASVDQVRDIRDKAQAVRQYAKKTGIAQEIIVEASAIKVEAERKLGQLLREMPLPNASLGNQYTSKSDRSHNATGPVRLRDLGVTKSESSRAQRIAGLPDADFNRYIKDNVQAGREPTMSGVLRLARDMEMAESVENHQSHLTGVVNVLNELVEQGSKFGTIYADPPWPYDNQGTRAATGNHYPTMSIDEIRAEPVSDLAADNCHLHLWTTTSFLPEALELIDAWGFTYKSRFVSTKPTLGLGNYWRCSHEFCVVDHIKILMWRRYLWGVAGGFCGFLVRGVREGHIIYGRFQLFFILEVRPCLRNFTREDPRFRVINTVLWQLSG